MRGLLLAVAMVAATPCAYGADLDYLRGGFSGTTTTTNWSGVYVGGQVSYGSADMDFGQATQDLFERLLNHTAFETNSDTSGNVANDTRVSRWRMLDDTTQQSTGFGGFVGYNWQWSDALIGLEMNYTHGKFSGSSSGRKGRFDFTSVPDYISQLDATASASMVINDFGSLRVRGGYAFGCFLPYAFAGVAMGQANITRNVAVGIEYVPAQVPPTKPAIDGFTGSLSDNGNNRFIYGYAAGVGFDWMITGGLFVRGEWEYLRFTSAVDTTINTVRAGVGYKF